MKKFKRGGAPSYTMDVNYDPNQLGGYFPEYIDPSVGLFGGTPQTYRERQWADEAARRAATSARRDILDELGEPYYTPEQRAKLDEEAKKRAEEQAKLDKEAADQAKLDDITAAEAELESLYRQRDVVIDPETGEKVYKNTGLSVKDTPFDIDAYFADVAEKRAKVMQARQAARDAGLNIPGDGPLDAVGTLLSRASRYTGIPLPDLVTGGPGGVTAVFGKPSGTPVGTKAVPKTAGTTWTGGPMRAGVLTGIPAIDILLSKKSEEGGGLGIPNLEDIGDILRDANAPDPGQTFTGDTTDKDKKTEFGVNNNKTPKKPEVPEKPKVPEKPETPTPPGGDLNNGKPGGSDKTLAGDDETSGGGGGGGGGGAGYGQGIGITTGAPGPTVDIDYLYDIAGESIFNPAMGKTEEEKEDKKNKRGPYVYANMGGMIRNNYDLTDEILRLLRRR